MPNMTFSLTDLPKSTEDYSRSRRAIYLIKAAINELNSIPETSTDRLAHDLSANQANRFADALDTIYCMMLCQGQKPHNLLPIVNASLKHAVLDD